MSATKAAHPFQQVFARMTRPERAVLVLLFVFGCKFALSTAARFLPALTPLDALGSGRPADVWLALLCAAAWLGFYCLLRRVLRATGTHFTRFELAVLAACIVASGVFYLSRMLGRQTLYIWDYATYYNLQLRLEDNFADGVFYGVGATLYKTWFNDYAPLVICLLSEPFFALTARTANAFATLSALLAPTFAYFGFAVLANGLRRRFSPRRPRLFFGLAMGAALTLPLLHAALYRGMPDLWGCGFAFLLLALALGYDFSAPAPARLVSMAAVTGLLLLTRRSYLFFAAVFFLLYGLWALWRACTLHWGDGSGALGRLLRFATAALAGVGLPLLPMFYNILRQNYADKYAGYLAGGFGGELANQAGYLGLLALGIAGAGLVYGLCRKAARPLALLCLGGIPLALFCITRVQNIDVHQSLALVPLYLLALALAALGVASLRRAALAGALGAVFGGVCLVNAAVCGFGLAAPGPRSLYSSAALTVTGTRQDLAGITAVNAWLEEHCTAPNSAYMICHGTTYSPEVFRESCLPDETIRTLLPYGAADPGNDKFPVELFTAQAVLTCTPFDGINHTEKLNAAFLQVQGTLAHFTLSETFAMGNGYQIEAYLRTAPATRAEVETYRAALAAEDARYPANFGAVLDEYETANGL